MKVLWSYIIPALLTGVLGFTLGIWWTAGETKPTVVTLERQDAGSDTPEKPAPRNTPAPISELQFNDISRQPGIFEQLHLTYRIAGQSNLDQLSAISRKFTTVRIHCSATTSPASSWKE